MWQELRVGTGLAALVIAVAALAVALSNSGPDGGANAATSAAGAVHSGGVTVAPFQEKGHTIAIENFAYGLDPIHVQAGEAVVWVNYDQVPHTATAKDGSWDSGTLAQGDGVVMVFDEPGTYQYICLLHPPVNAIAGAPEGVKLAGGGRPMQGTVIVEE
jgi:plastocyanin